MWNQSGIGERCKFHEPHAIVVTRQLGRRLERQACFSDAARAAEGEQPRAPERLPNLGNFAAAPDESRQLLRQVVPRWDATRGAFGNRLRLAKILDELGSALEPIVRFLLETSADQPFETARNARIDRLNGSRVMTNDLINHLVRRVSRKRQTPGGHLIKHDSETEKIRAVIELLPHRLFRRHVRHRAQDDA